MPMIPARGAVDVARAASVIGCQGNSQGGSAERRNISRRIELDTGAVDQTQGSATLQSEHRCHLGDERLVVDGGGSDRIAEQNHSALAVLQADVDKSKQQQVSLK